MEFGSFILKRVFIMKKILTLLAVSLLLITTKANAMTFEEAYAQSSVKPMLILVYADWAENAQSYVQAFNALQAEFGETYNFVTLNIASSDTKAFNARYHIYPNLPYVLMFRDGGKVSRYIQRECILDESCLVPKLKSFVL